MYIAGAYVMMIQFERLCSLILHQNFIWEPFFPCLRFEGEYFNALILEWKMK